MHGVAMPCHRGSKMSLLAKNTWRASGVHLKLPRCTWGWGRRALSTGWSQIPLEIWDCPHGTSTWPCPKSPFFIPLRAGQENSQLCSQQLREMGARRAQLALGVMGLLYTARPAPIHGSPER